MGSDRVVPFREELVPDAVKLCVEGVRRVADRIGRPLVQPSEVPAEPVVEAALRRFLSEPESRRAWAVVDGGELRAFAGALIERLAPDDVRYTYMPPRSLTIGATALHAVSEEAASECYPPLLGEARRLAESIGGARLFVNSLSGDRVAELGLRLSSVMARRRVAGWRSPGGPFEVRTARPDDVEAITDLAMEEHHYHAEHTAFGASPDVPRATSLPPSCSDRFSASATRTWPRSGWWARWWPAPPCCSPGSWSPWGSTGRPPPRPGCRCSDWTCCST